MNNTTQSLVAVGAAAAVNCKPCLEHLVPASIEAGATQADIRRAIDTGLRVSEGARTRTQEFVPDVLAAARIQTHDDNRGCSDERKAEQNRCC